MKGRVVALAFLVATLSAAAAPAAAPLLQPASSPDACSQEITAPVAGFSPLSNIGSVTPDASTYGCYRLYLSPGFPFRGTIAATLTDQFGRSASLSQHCSLSGLDPLVPGVVGCTAPSGSAPPLALGPMTLRCTITDATSPLGGWECGAVFGH